MTFPSNPQAMMPSRDHQKPEWRKDSPRVNTRPNQPGRKDQPRNPVLKEPLPISGISLTNALKSAQKEGYLKDHVPKMVSGPRSRDTRQFCRYHQDHGYLTNNCQILKRDLEDLIARGYLKDLVLPAECRNPAPTQKDRRSHSRSPRPRPLMNDQPAETAYKGVINVDHDPKKTRIEELVSFSEEVLQSIETPHDDPLVITTTINGYQVKRIMVDTGSSMDVLYTNAFEQMGIDRSRLQPCRVPLISFTGHSLLPEGVITLPMTLGAPPKQVTTQIQFLMMDMKSAHNVISGQTALHSLRAIASTYHQVLKFPTPNGVGVVQSSQKEARSYYLLSVKGKGAQGTMSIKKACL
ncbi:uncharacterized protein LOC109841696 [Asparagus officinalis]|uniref:uncharacterized protein LOC109841696 n=1 Tax=Asparagus officinalis TaxID=4686 RepID=UPI00098E4EF7|nr:uncharacterized protein LOC109841696 [Asparagus officinalis]